MATKTEMEHNKAVLKAERARYMAHDITHDAYYCWLSDWIGLPESLIPASAEETRRSQDPHYNDIPLARWDRMHAAVTAYAHNRGLPWALSDTVCCLKAMARRRAEREGKAVAS